ncbi:hypothetical protein GKE82_11145 [Conexibacter sp. W3-3-2]|uniref:fibronectin type III domain-containing protein n=1 Tax=Conexibacter sp. W3-3-2 TaxID=2675227 RepID=UPI0012B8A1DA|nr:fibronectin type III domain-containing protein [Conexibacter sp. W3-3-2]MTD44831.1 hypothetical protein [Conexibacter sp. W3-3-2]
MLLPTASALTPSEISPTTLSFSWSGPAGASYVVRRAPGFDAPATPSAGAAVAVVGSAASDTGLTPGSQYSYSVFTVTGGRTLGPATLTVGTAPAPGGAAPTFVAAPGTAILTKADVASARPLTQGAAVRLAGGQSLPAVGDHLVVPATGEVDLAFVGRVASIAVDGTLTVVPVSLPDAFDYVDLVIPDFERALRPVGPRTRAGLRASRRSCGGEGTAGLGVKPDVGLGGGGRIEISTGKFLGLDVPKGVNYDLGLSVRAQLRIFAEVTGKLDCNVELATVTQSLTPPPVPTAVSFTPRVSMSASAAARYVGGGVSAEAGVAASGSLPGTPQVKPIFNGKVLEASGVDLSGQINARLQGSITLGPGAGAGPAGLVVGPTGTITPIDVTVSAAYDSQDPRNTGCAVVRAGGSAALGISARGSVLGKGVDWYSELLDGSFEYFKRAFPQDCDKKPAPATPADPGTSVPPPTGGGGSQLPDCDCGPPPGFRRTSVV